MRAKILLAFAISIGSIAAPSAAQLSAPECLPKVYGIWDAGDGTKIKISDCGNATPCGDIIGLSDPNLPDGNNPNEDLRADPLIGKKMIYGFKKSRKGWKSGKIYNPANGKTYGSRLQTLGTQSLEVKGCIGPFCQTQTWKRLSDSVCRQ